MPSTSTSTIGKNFAKSHASDLCCMSWLCIQSVYCEVAPALLDQPGAWIALVYGARPMASVTARKARVGSGASGGTAKTGKRRGRVAKPKLLDSGEVISVV